MKISAWANAAGQRAEDVARNVAVEAYSRLVARSPVGDPSLWKSPAPKGYVGGTFRRSWMIEELVPGRFWSIWNAQPYAWSLELGSSTQAPQGMVGLTVLEFSQIVDLSLRLPAAADDSLGVLGFPA
jgi:hypothetical protein